MTEWDSGLFGCFSECGLCVVTYILPCYTFGKTAETLGESCCTYALSLFVPILNMVCLVKVRGRVREKYGIEGDTLNDCLMVFCCPLCTLVQEAIQVKNPGGQSMSRE
ncbi:uncharacterized protein LOC100373489 [Saccoglossus kowalevskii]|uniref:Protein PLANT CADMIUM RESISTANCE 3-like n=1 Tax=Saccoglossus kowalevskii TaxID=10224 RepID=A0ABM0GYT7_SACKO|nr:PREDICTED: protein PLANT CADMIUM RESISTANCE 3-like [Saccoglossus kowalevskii]